MALATINKLTEAPTLTGSDQIAVWNAQNADSRRASLNTLLAFLSGEITAADDMVTQYSAPNSSGFNVLVSDGPDSIWLILTPTGTLAAGTITLPALANCVDRQNLLVNTTQAITTLTVAGNGATVNGAPATLTAGGYFRLRFDAVLSSWYRVG